MICTQCGKEFAAKRSTAKFCSAACRVKRSRGYETIKQNPQTPPPLPTMAQIVEIAEKIEAKKRGKVIEIPFAGYEGRCSHGYNLKTVKCKMGCKK